MKIGTKTSEAKVTIDSTDYEVTPAVWTGTTPLSAYNLNKMQDNIEEEVNITLDTEEPAEEVEITNVAPVNGKIDVSGNSTQETRSGKNLAKILDGSYTFGSVPFTVEKGIIKLTGAPTGNYMFSEFQVNSGNATLSIDVTGYTDSVSSACYIILQESSNRTDWISKISLTCTSTTVKQKTETLDSTKYYRIRWYTEGNTFTNGTIKVQLEYGTEKTSFEQYGVSPSPEYPSEIHNVGDNVNLFDKNINAVLTNAANSEILDTGLKLISTITSSSVSIYKFYKLIDLTNYVGKTITMKTNFTKSNNSLAPQYGMSLCDSNGSNRISKVTTTNSGEKISFVVPELDGTSNYLMVRLQMTVSTAATSGDYVEFTDIKVEIGDTSNVIYSPYNCGNTNIEVSNANIFNKETMAFTRRVMQADESVINTSNPYIATSGRISLKAGTYSFYARDLVNWSAYIQAYKNGTRVTQFPIGGNAKGHVFTLDEDYDIHLQLNTAAGSGVNIDSYLPTINDRAILLKGNITTEPDYIEHQSQLKTFPFAEGQRMYLGDYLASDGIHHKMAQVDLSTLTWNSYATNKYRSTDLRNAVITGTSEQIPYDALAEKYIVVANAKSFVNGDMAIDSMGNVSIFDNTGTPTGILEYKLKTEIIEPFTPEQEEAYWQLQHALMYEKYTKVECIDETKAKFVVTYFYNNQLNETYQSQIDTLNKQVYDLENEEISSLDIYTTTEQRIGTWTNNKPIYRKVIQGQWTGTYQEDGQIYQMVNTNFDIDELIDIKVIITATISGENSPRKFNVNAVRRGDTGNTQFSMSTSFYTNGASYILIMEYTKTTD